MERVCPSCFMRFRTSRVGIELVCLLRSDPLDRFTCDGSRTRKQAIVLRLTSFFPASVVLHGMPS